MEDRAADDLVRVDSILRGDRDAFADLVRRYQSLVAGVAWRYGIRRDDIEDIVSEVMIKVFKNLHLYRPDYPFSTWLYRLAANHVLDQGRRARREHGRTEMPAEIADDTPGPGEGMEGRERAALVRSALEEIDSRYREVIFLVYVEGNRVDEVARTLGIPEGTVKTRLMRGREALRRILVRHHPEHFGV
ncbi:MAG: sigma-70 family RNA polymerase sigma factor [Acidobacteriia bacterium]|jgi:RNA polymerase sigma-70 factor (ECF subfamily)|nr:sigma-70 family RNA polymerase sigma factor [Terriglobia bacterium]